MAIDDFMIESQTMQYIELQIGRYDIVHRFGYMIHSIYQTMESFACEIPKWFNYRAIMSSDSIITTIHESNISRRLGLEKQ
jgi:hypothetical protein